MNPIDNRFSLVGDIFNIKPVINAAVNKLDLFAKSSGVAPTTDHPIGVNIPDGNGVTFRIRNASYLSGTSQFILNDANAYWGAVSGADNYKIHIYEIYDANGGIVHALSRYSGFYNVPTTTTVDDDDYFLLENGSSYTRAATDFCICVGWFWANYNTANTPDWTILNTANLKPGLKYDPPSNYGYDKLMAVSIVSASDIPATSVVNVVVKQSRWYNIWGKVNGRCGISPTTLLGYIKTGSATYGSATQQDSAEWDTAGNGMQNNVPLFAHVFLTAGETIHLGAYVSGAGSDRIVYAGNTRLKFKAAN